MPAKKKSMTAAAKGKGKAKRKAVEEEHAAPTVPGEESEPEEEVESVVGGAVSRKKAKTGSGKKSSGPVTSTQQEYTEQQEETLATYILDHEELYDQTSRDFKNTSRKDRLWEECGALVGVNGKVLYMYKTQWSAYGRIKKMMNVSGLAPKVEFSDRNGCGRSEFLKTPCSQQERRRHHLARVGKGGSNDDDDDGDRESLAGSAAGSVVMAGPGPSKPPGHYKGKGKGKDTATLDTVLTEYLSRQATQRASYDRELQDTLSSMTQARDQAAIWGESLAMSARRLPDNLFRRFQMDSLALMNQYLQMAERGEDPDQQQQQYQVMQPLMKTDED
ncbi:hypothetical protein GWK47_022619 [Chionoecetes opilio]|uniref:Uncharacterized protein n=1 Tax=Chionoecetes opilio TaxID=41210 RepID=A0A8J4XMY6_CHIOP|nr:hypothetical protein GWK47_022619 [Chionoecetes opilio]